MSLLRVWTTLYKTAQEFDMVIVNVYGCQQTRFLMQLQKALETKVAGSEQMHGWMREFNVTVAQVSVQKTWEPTQQMR